MLRAENHFPYEYIFYFVLTFWFLAVQFELYDAKLILVSH